MAIPGDSRFGQWADPNFGRSLSTPGRTTSPVLPAPESDQQSASDNSSNWSASDNTAGYDAHQGHQAFKDYQGYSDYYDKMDTGDSNVLKGGKITNLSTRPWGENEVDPNTGKLGWQQNYWDVAGGAMGMAEGGMVPGDDPDQDTGNAAPAQPDPFEFISSALSYGRQKFRMPNKLFGEPAEPVTGYAEGGEVEEEPEQEGVLPSPDQAAAPQEPQIDPQAAMAYLKGAGAAPPDVAAALEQRVDPVNAMDPTERRMKAVTAAGTPDRAFGLMQHYRQKFNAYSAFADAALKGAGGRPPNIEKAADALNKAYDHVPDGQSVRFSPASGGMHVTVKTIPSKPPAPGGDKPNENPFPTKDGGFGKRTAMNDGDEDDTQNFAEGGEVEDNNYDVTGDPATQAYQSGSQESAGVLPGYDPSQDPMGAPVPEEQEESRGGAGEAIRKVAQPVGRAVADAAESVGGQVADQVSRTPGAVKSYFVKLGNLVGIGQKAGFDATLDKGGFDAAAVEHLTPTDLGPNMEDQGVTSHRSVDENSPSRRMAADPYNQGQPASPRQFGQQVARETMEDLDDPKQVLKAMLKTIDQQYQSVGSYAANQEAKRAAYQVYLKGLQEQGKEKIKGENSLQRTAVKGEYDLDKTDKVVEGKQKNVETQQTHGDARAHEKNMTKTQIEDANRKSREEQGGLNRENRTTNTLLNAAPGVHKDPEKFRQAMTNVGQGAAPARQQPAQQEYPPAPQNPTERQAGKVYKSPTGKLGMWTGQGWQVLQ